MLAGNKVEGTGAASIPTEFLFFSLSNRLFVPYQQSSQPKQISTKNLS